MTVARGHIVVRRKAQDGSPGADGEQGPRVEFCTYSSGKAYCSGAVGEGVYHVAFHATYQQFFRCIQSYPASQTHAPSQSASNAYWEYMPGLEQLVVDMLCANEAFLNNLTVRHMYTTDGKCQILEGGLLKAVDGIFEGNIKATSGSVGGFDIQTTSLQNGDIDEDNSEMFLSRDIIGFHGKDIGISDNSESYISLGSNVWPSTLGGDVACQSIELNDDDTSPMGRFNAGIYLSVQGTNKTNCAIYAEKGIFGGLRPYTKVLSSSTTLSKMWYHILCVESSAITLTMPSNPEEGQTYEILRINAYAITISGNGKQVWRVDLPSQNVYSITIAGGTRECLRCVYGNSKWYVFPYRN